MYNTSEPIYGQEISDKTLETAAELLLYVSAPKAWEENWRNWYNQYSHWLIDVKSFSRLLGNIDVHIFRCEASLLVGLSVIVCLLLL
jgi:hypothetical protein